MKTLPAWISNLGQLKGWIECNHPSKICIPTECALHGIKEFNPFHGEFVRNWDGIPVIYQMPSPKVSFT